MSLIPPALLSTIGEARVLSHFVLHGGTAAERHSNDQYIFSPRLMNRSELHWRGLVAKLSRPVRRATQVVLCPKGPGSVLGKRVAEILKLPRVRTHGRERDCELVNKKEAKELQGRTCLLVDACCDTAATLASLARTAQLCGANVSAALVLVMLERKLDGFPIPRLPLAFDVVSYTTKEVCHWTPNQCPSCRQRQALKSLGIKKF